MDANVSPLSHPPLAHRWGYATTPGFRGWEPERIIAALARLGYRHMEWTLDALDPRALGDAAVVRALRAAGDHGLAVSEYLILADYVTGDATTRAKAIALSRRAIDIAAEAGVDRVGLYSGPDSWDPAHPSIPGQLASGEAWARAFAALDELVALAEARGVTVTFKTCHGTLAYDVYSTQPVIERYGTRMGFGLNLDPSHFVLCGNDLIWTVERWASLIRHVQLKDVFGVPGEEHRSFHFPLLGEGKVDWPGFFGALDRAGYRGAFVVLFESYALFERLLGRDPIAAATLAMERLRRLEQAVSQSSVNA
ncbi:MAG: sugar phosphate isomerase/epimerase [Alphaproteobacteria bacterium]|nr:sugar phosphate isomerase/epimerase [Alphaproteobacteria bacterium]